MTPENPEIIRLEEILMNEDYDSREKTTFELAQIYSKLQKEGEV